MREKPDGLCPVCGARLQDNARFCLHCMTSFEQKAPVQAAAPKKRGKLLAAAGIAAAAALLTVLLVLLHSGGPEPFTDYETFYAAVLRASETLALSDLWSPEDFLDVQYDTKTKTQKYTAPVRLDGARLDFFLRDDGCVATLILTDVPENRLADAKKICAAVHGAVTNRYSDIYEILTDTKTYRTNAYAEPYVAFFCEMTGRAEQYAKAVAGGAQYSTRFIRFAPKDEERLMIFFETERKETSGTLYDLVLRFDYPENKEVSVVR
ncbi:MAG: zinc ribbon domain-containing protein [Clostridia bacterium]|nr:zinc ribbon domain-containing protein [Clostridia bacterium]